MARTPLRRSISDVRALSALAHPVRVALLDQLMAYGPRTASQCAPQAGVSASACSYHLRQLARWGLVEPAPPAGGRDRPWQAAATGFDFRPGVDTPAGQAAQHALLALQIDRDADAARDYLRRSESVEPSWRDVATLSRYGLRLTADELRELVAALDEAIRPYIGLVRADPPAGARPVHLDLHAFVQDAREGEA